MPFRADQFHPICGFENSDTPRIWSSIHTNLPNDTDAVQAAANYFNDALTEGFDIKVGDFIYAGHNVVVSSVSLLGVTEITDGVVTTEDMETAT